jgi:hypothetical protein
MNNFSEAQFTKKGANVFVHYPHFSYPGMRLSNFEFSEQYNTSTDNLKANLRSRFNAKFGPGSFVKYMRRKKPASNNNGMNVNNAPRTTGRKRKTVNYNFRGWTATPWGHTYTIRYKTGEKVSEAEKKAYLNAHPNLVVGEKRKRSKGGIRPQGPTSAYAMYGFSKQSNAVNAIKKLEKTTRMLPGLGTNQATNLLSASLQNSISHFSTPAVRQGYSGSILETTSFALAARASNVNVIYFDEIGNDITQILGRPRTFILKSKFTLDKVKTDQNNRLGPVWKSIVRLGATKASINQYPNDILKWNKNTTSHYKGFWDVEPDVLEWVPADARINIYELKVGEGKPEMVPAEAFQLLKAKRAIELEFKAANKPSPKIRLYFLPWMYGSKTNQVKFKNYKNFPGVGVETWKVLRNIDPDGYTINELKSGPFAAMTGLDPALMTYALDVFRGTQTKTILQLLTHINRHSFAYSGINKARLQRVAQVTRTAPPGLANRAKFGTLTAATQRAVPANAPPGMNRLAHYILTRPQGVKNNKASSIAERALKRLASRTTSKYAVKNQSGRVIGPANIGFTAGNNYVSNAEGSNNRNRKEKQRVNAALSRPNVINPMTLLALQQFSISQKNVVPENTKKIMNIVSKNKALPPAAVYTKFAQQFLPNNDVKVKAILSNLSTNMTYNNKERAAALLNSYNNFMTRIRRR